MDSHADRSARFFTSPSPEPPQRSSSTRDPAAPPPRYTVAIDLAQQTSAAFALGNDWDHAFDAQLTTATDETPTINDYRLSPITVMSTSGSAALKGNAAAADPPRAQYMGYGVVRLFREYNTDNTHEIEVESDDTTVAIVAVPNYFSPTDVLAFIGESVLRDMSHLRMVKSDNPNRFMVLMKFRSNESARSFQDSYNGRPFNSLESECCHTIFVKSVIFRPLNSSTVEGIPYLLEDPFTLQVKKSRKNGESLEGKSVVKELPTCPVCLERMDSDVTGLVTISCQHTFHCNCLSKWRDDTCPVCRYSNLSLDALRRSDSRDAIQHCTSCGGTQNLWICLICGNIGCGRYDSKHAIEHYESTNHCFAMDIATQRVWDYAGDNYVHRLLQNETDGKLVELPAANSCSSSEFGSGSRTDDLKDKNRDYSIEYSNVLLSQLESQREYYESRLAESADQLKKMAEENAQNMAKLDQKNEETERKIAELEEKFKSVNVADQMNNIKKAKELARMFEKKWKDELMLTESLSKNMDKLRTENEELKKQNKELQEQVSDMMMHFETQQKFQDMPEDVREGQIVMRPAPQRRNRKTARK